jgi:predicted nucleic acid-binding Zn ribbon protein
MQLKPITVIIVLLLVVTSLLVVGCLSSNNSNQETSSASNAVTTANTTTASESATPSASPTNMPPASPTDMPLQLPVPTPVPTQCNHVSIVVHKMNDTPCNTCAMDTGMLSQFYAGNQYVTVSGVSFYGGPNHYITATVLETGQSATFSIYDLSLVEAWTNSILTCK